MYNDYPPYFLRQVVGIGCVMLIALILGWRHDKLVSAVASVGCVAIGLVVIINIWETLSISVIARLTLSTGISMVTTSGLVIGNFEHGFSMARWYKNLCLAMRIQGVVFFVCAILLAFTG